MLAVFPSCVHGFSGSEEILAKAGRELQSAKIGPGSFPVSQVKKGQANSR